MKPIGVFLWAAFAVSTAVAESRFASVPSIRQFDDGAWEWSATVSCADVTLLADARVAFFLDTKLEGPGSATSPVATSALSPADCEDGVLPLRRSFFPPVASLPAVLRAELRRPVPAGLPGFPDSTRDSVADVHSLLSRGLGSLLMVRRFCARPQNGEPEWIEVRNVSPESVSLSKVKLEGRALSLLIGLAPGESFAAVAAADTTELRLWQPGVRPFALSSWSSLRNSGDTLRLSIEDGMNARLVLDSVVYGSAISAREDCASVPREESAGAAHGFGLEPVTKMRIVNVIAPSEGRYHLRVYDLDGLEICALARDAVGSRSFSFPSAACAVRRPGPVLLQLLPRDAPSVRRVLWVKP